jgi:hypothetical protein
MKKKKAERGLAAILASRCNDYLAGQNMKTNSDEDHMNRFQWWRAVSQFPPPTTSLHEVPQTFMR